ncbi:MAG: thioredoxin-dependent thiol peroxidase [Prevotella sp.]|jgi:peroxiredoxin Q/BCP|nr:thioredoxin-dependent thiol peroxidase [Prevotella sp.]
MALTIGDKIPDILGKDQSGKELKAGDFAGKKLVLYFYPKDNTPGCTAEACSFRDNFGELRKAGYQILGVSVDSENSHRKFIEKQQLPFPLIADTDKRLVGLFGVWGEKTLAGRKYMGTFRTTFLINESGIIENIIAPKEIKTKEHAEQILNQK